MFSIYICEDQKEILNHHQSLITEYVEMENLSIEHITAVTSPDELLTVLSSYAFVPSGLYFLDIDLNHEMNGIRLAERIREFDPRGFIVFITAFESYLPHVLENDIEPLQFIKKDSSDHMEKRILHCIDTAFSRYCSSANTIQKTFQFSTREKTFVFDYNDIVCFQINVSHKIKMYTLDSFYLFTGDISKIYQSIDQDIFFQCHSSCIINLNHLKEFDSKANEVIMRNSYRCPVSFRKKKSLNEKIKRK